MKHTEHSSQRKRDHSVVTPNFFGEGQHLEAWQLGWDPEYKLEAKSSVSKKVFNYFVEDRGSNMIFYYPKDGNFYGIHSEICPTPVFKFKKVSGGCTYDELGDQDTHDYQTGEILYWVGSDENIWDVVRINNESLEEILENAYIVNIA